MIEAGSACGDAGPHSPDQPRALSKQPPSCPPLPHPLTIIPFPRLAPKTSHSPKKISTLQPESLVVFYCACSRRQPAMEFPAAVVAAAVVAVAAVAAAAAVLPALAYPPVLDAHLPPNSPSPPRRPADDGLLHCCCAGKCCGNGGGGGGGRTRWSNHQFCSSLDGGGGDSGSTLIPVSRPHSPAWFDGGGGGDGGCDDGVARGLSACFALRPSSVNTDSSSSWCGGCSGGGGGVDVFALHLFLLSLYHQLLSTLLLHPR